MKTNNQITISATDTATAKNIKNDAILAYEYQ